MTCTESHKGRQVHEKCLIEPENSLPRRSLSATRRSLPSYNLATFASSSLRRFSTSSTRCRATRLRSMPLMSCARVNGLSTKKIRCGRPHPQASHLEQCIQPLSIIPLTPILTGLLFRVCSTGHEGERIAAHSKTKSFAYLNVAEGEDGHLQPPQRAY